MTVLASVQEQLIKDLVDAGGEGVDRLDMIAASLVEITEELKVLNSLLRVIAEHFANL